MRKWFSDYLKIDCDRFPGGFHHLRGRGKRIRTGHYMPSIGPWGLWTWSSCRKVRVAISLAPGLTARYISLIALLPRFVMYPDCSIAIFSQERMMNFPWDMATSNAPATTVLGLRIRTATTTRTRERSPFSGGVYNTMKLYADCTGSNGPYYYSKPNGSTFYSSKNGSSTYIPPTGSGKE